MPTTQAELAKLGSRSIVLRLAFLLPSIIATIQVSLAQENVPRQLTESLTELKTIAEASDYRATANGADTELFLKRLQRL